MIEGLRRNFANADRNRTPPLHALRQGFLNGYKVNAPIHRDVDKLSPLNRCSFAESEPLVPDCPGLERGRDGIWMGCAGFATPYSAAAS